MNFILTGHKGLIGSFLLKKLKEKGHHPVASIDKRDKGDISEIEKLGYKPKIDVFQGLKICCSWYKAHLNEILESRK